MIIHRHSDGSEGYEYRVGDVVEITGVVPASEWFKRAIGRIGPIVEIGRGDWRIAFLRVRDVSDFGPAHCAPWQVKPTAETVLAASVVTA